MEKIRVAISGYGNVGKGVEQAIMRNDDMELVSIITRRVPSSISPATKDVLVVHENDVSILHNKVDIVILCGGSATDLPIQGPQYATAFNTLDSFDTHARIPGYFEAMNTAAKESGNLSLISCGWDPGIFSIMRVLGLAFLPQGESYTFWGKGVSQGHSDALRRVPGVKSAIQYTIPIDSAIDAVRTGSMPTLSTREKHTRECFVVAEENADLARIENDIKSMPNYFSDYETTVHFITEEEFKANHSGMPHGGFVFRSGETGTANNHHIIEFSLNLDSNPEFTASVLVAYARAVVRLAKEGRTGAVSVFDIPPALLVPLSADDLRKTLL